MFSVICCVALGLLLGSMGFHASSSWQYWAVGLLVIAIDLQGGLTKLEADWLSRPKN